MSCGIYKFENKINGMIYIGQAIDLVERYNKHCKNINDKNHNEAFYQALREYGMENFSYSILEEFNIFDQELLNQLEIYYIEYYNSLTPNGYNMVPGGTNGAGLAKGKKVLQYDLQGNFIAEYDSAHQASRATNINNSSISACCRGDITHTKEFQWKYKNDDKEIKALNNNAIIIRDRKICQYDLQHNLLNIYNSLREAAETTNTNKVGICRVCSGQSYSAGGYLWEYQDIPIQHVLKPPKGVPTKRVAQYSKQGDLIAVYESLSEAAKQTNTNIGNLGSVCQGKRKTANNFVWKYLD